MIVGIDETFICPICKRMHTSDKMSWHHLLPKTGTDEREEPRIYVCITCHTVIHYCHNNKTLREIYNTLEKLLNSSDIIKMVDLYKYSKPNKIIKIKKLKQLKKCA